MLDVSQLQLALLDVSEGAAALVQAGLASDAAPTVAVSAEFTHMAVTGPLERLATLLGEEPRPPRAARPRRRRKARRASQQALAPGQLPKPAVLDDFDRVSVWDPDERPYSPDSDPLLEAGSCRALLLEIVRRASYDWVLYRTSSKLVKRQLAEDAYRWLFVEEPDSLLWQQRQQADKELTGFVAICEAVGVDPDRVRARIRLLTERDIMGAGRPAEKRKHKASSDDMLQSDDMRVFDVNIDAIPTYDYMFSSPEG